MLEMAVPFQIYADFKSILKWVKTDKNKSTLYTEKYQAHVPCIFFFFFTKLFILTMNLAKKIVLYRWIDAKTQFIEAILEEYEYFKKK